MLFRKKGPSTSVTSALQWGFTVLLNYLGGLGRYFLLCVKHALLSMWDFAVGCHMFYYCLFHPPKAIENSSGLCFIFKFLWDCVLSAQLGGGNSFLWIFFIEE